MGEFPNAFSASFDARCGLRERMDLRLRPMLTYSSWSICRRLRDSSSGGLNGRKTEVWLFTR
jgi:hypothetical protein